MSSIKSQTKWVMKYLANTVLVLLVVLATISFFTTKVSVSNFATASFLAVVVILLLTYYGLMNVRSALTFVVIAIVLLVGVVYSDLPKVNSGLFQSVTLTTGQTYFGHLSNVNAKSATLKNVYTIQNIQQPTTTGGKTTTTSKPVLVKLSTIIPGSEEQMVIKTDKIAYWSNLQNSSKVSQAINKDINK